MFRENRKHTETHKHRFFPRNIHVRRYKTSRINKPSLLIPCIKDFRAQFTLTVVSYHPFNGPTPVVLEWAVNKKESQGRFAYTCTHDCRMNESRSKTSGQRDTRLSEERRFQPLRNTDIFYQTVHRTCMYGQNVGRPDLY